MEWKEMKTTWETSGKTLNIPTFSLWGSRGEEWEKGPEKIFEELITENFPNMGKEIVSRVQKAQSPSKDKRKEEHT